MKSELGIGVTWAHLKVLAGGIGEYSIDRGDGVIDRYPNQQYWDTKCSCGKVIKIWNKEWDGKQAIKDCGCGASLLDGESVIVSACIPLELKLAMKRYAVKNRLSFSRAVIELLTKELEDERAKSEQAEIGT